MLPILLFMLSFSACYPLISQGKISLIQDILPHLPENYFVQLSTIFKPQNAKARAEIHSGKLSIDSQEVTLNELEIQHVSDLSVFLVCFYCIVLFIHCHYLL